MGGGNGVDNTPIYHDQIDLRWSKREGVSKVRRSWWVEIEDAEWCMESSFLGLAQSISGIPPGAGPVSESGKVQYPTDSPQHRQRLVNLEMEGCRYSPHSRHSLHRKFMRWLKCLPSRQRRRGHTCRCTQSSDPRALPLIVKKAKMDLISWML